ncbi:MFS transporter [Martelella sp. HB161492]|uniref:MFS transporter n=1 Tax=Martelella sp. HB161492 TaxID=2720726 RepID=UPI001FEE9A91|nr:MFS transporter [Martelella sp. HB161492]
MNAERRMSPGGLTPVVLYAMTLAAGLAAANVYYNQPMLGLIEADFPGSVLATYIPTATQLGFAAGLFFLLPLGDILNRRRLIITQFAVIAVASGLTALSPTPLLLALASILLGAGAAVAQQIVPYAAALASDAARGRTIGVVMAGLLTGILFSRTLSGFVGELAGWRSMFWLGVPLAIIGVVSMAATLPDHPPVSKMRYRAALASLAHYWRQHPALRIAAFVQAGLFGAFTAFWSILALYLATPQFGLGADVAGLFGIVGVAGILAAPLAGRLADRRGPHLVVIVGAMLALAAWLLFGLTASLIALVVGVVILDLGIQGALVSNQHIIYALDPAARSRINTLFMTVMFLGGALGSSLAAFAWGRGSWPMVSLTGIALAGVAVLVKLHALRSGRRSASGLHE